MLTLIIVIVLIAVFWRWIAVLGALYLFLGALFLLCFLGVEAFHLLVRLIGRPLATAIVDPIIAITVIVGPVLFWIDSTDDFGMTRATFRWITGTVNRTRRRILSR